MPHPRKFLKQTGDTHPPEVEYDLAASGEPQEGAAAGEDRPQAEGQEQGAAGDTGGGEVPSPRRGEAAGMRLDAATERYLDAARAEVRRKPLAYAAGAFAIGFVLAVITRS